MRYCLRRPDIERPWLFDRCREVEADPNEHLDLWARFFYKSTIITFGLTIQDILRSHGDDAVIPFEHTICILSQNRPAAKKFLGQIKNEFEVNATLKNWFPDIFYADPRNQSPRWSLDDGLIVKRKGNMKEATLEATGLVDSQVAGPHYTLRVYDDTVTSKSVTTAEMINKTTAAWELSQSLKTENGLARYVGTKYALFDTYRAMEDRGIKVRRYPCTKDGTDRLTPDNCVLYPVEFLAKTRKDQGPSTFCFPPETPILMADWTEKRITEVVAGDWVVGYDFPKSARSKLVRSRVRAVSGRIANVIEAQFESGRIARCTDDHRWYTGRRGEDVGGPDNHSAYLPLGFRRCDLKALISVYDPRAIHIGSGTHEAGWLSGLFDGEGTVSGGTIHLSQSAAHNPAVCRRIEETLAALGFDYGKHSRGSGLGPGGRAAAIARGENVKALRQASNRTTNDYYLRGGRAERIRFLNICKPARAEKIVDHLFLQGAGEFGKACRDRLVAIRSLGPQRVYNIETETGNYVAWGYATKNSTQMLLDPKAGQLTGFKEEWLRYWKAHRYNGLNMAIIVDPASKKKKTSDYSVFWVVGLGADGNYYVCDLIRDRLNLRQRTETLFRLHRKWKPKLVGYEEYGMQADIEHMEWVMEEENYRFAITKLGGQIKKEDRIQRLQPIFETSRVYLPESGCVHVNYEGVAVDTIRTFIAEEYSAFPVTSHDDALDGLSRLEDDEVKLFLSKPSGSEENESKFMQQAIADHYGKHGSSAGWQGR